MKTVAIAQARMGSTRFPGKVLKPLAGRPVIAWVADALEDAPGIDEIVIATSTLSADDVIAQWCQENGISVFRGSESDVLDRFHQCAVEHEADIVLRITCDCPFIDPAVVGQVIQLMKLTGASYCSNQPTWPDGLDVECFTFAALDAAWLEATRQTDRDCVTQWIIRNQDRFPAEYLICPFPGAHKERWVLDTERDYSLCTEIAYEWGKHTPPSCTDIFRILAKRPGLRSHNTGAIRNERFYEGLAEEKLPERKFTRSESLLDQASRTIPFGSQTYSKSHLFYPSGGAPLYVSHGDGARIFDVDGQDYVDLVGALLPVVLGYRDPDVDEAVRRQLNNAGMSFSLPTKLEAELSELLCDLIPCADMVKLGKSGTDVTTAAVRAARAFTGAERVLVGGYHGWADWSMAVDPDKSLGIPVSTRKTSHKFTYGSVQEVELFGNTMSGDIAAIVVEPTHNIGYLKWLREFCSRRDIVLIFDEIQTGFRYDLGGAQKFYGVTPDLACFGKAMGNGMPISALVGKREIMSVFSPPETAFYSGTFFGDTLSIAAAIATIRKMQREDVIAHLWHTGIQIKESIGPGPIGLSGPACLTKLDFIDHERATARQIQALFMQEMAQQGVLIINAHGLSYAHKQPEIDRIVKAYRHTFDVINDCLSGQRDIEKVLKGTIKGIPVRKSA